MSGSTHGNPLQGREWLEELKTNKRTQTGLAAFGVALAFMVYMLWPEAPKRRPAKLLAVAAPSGDDRSFQALDKLPDLARLGRAGELPSEDRMYRDLFTFEGPPPPPPPPPTPLPPPPPPTEEQLKAMALQQAKDAEFATRPQGLRYLGYFNRKSVGRVGAFMKGEEALPLKLGDTMGANWKLIALTDTHAEFQNTKYPEQHSRIEATDAAGGPRGAGATNQF